ncbi:MAG: GGDEF domain-containing protein [Spongiibacteraceae bacterium]|jgi:diguanylate cyclase (GGDEF)-like protein|nr:GGDEF domain-containing protein [Spongiibacteraceae bacterium]
MPQLISQLHTPTLQVATALVLLFSSAAAVLLWLSARSERYTRYWAAGYAAITGGLILSALRGQLPIPLTVIASNALIVAGGAWLVNGTAIYCRRDHWHWPAGTLAALIAALFLVLVYVVPSFRLRVIIIAIYMLSVCVVMATLLWRHTTPGSRWLQRLLAGLLAVQVSFYALLASVRLIPTGAADYLDAPAAFNALYLNALLMIVAVLFGFAALTHRRLSLHLHYAANHDPLTGALNRRALDLEIDHQRSARQPLTLVLLDLDHFKRLNDTHGHHIGDLALIAFTETVRSGLRRNDSLGRIGGEEFCLLLPATDAMAAAHIVERLRCRVEAIELPEAPAARFTVSAGIATSPPCASDEASLMRAADRALYLAKAAGRNRVICAAEN